MGRGLETNEIESVNQFADLFFESWYYHRVQSLPVKCLAMSALR